MAKQTDHALNQALIYEINPYSFSDQHGFRGIADDLPRLKKLGVDIVWLMPIHPRNRLDLASGLYASAYSVRDYRAINPDYGTEEDFDEMVGTIHRHGMKMMMDIVYNHTARDSVLAQTHPEWFYHDKEGKPSPRVWKDCCDLDYSHKELWDYQIETLLYWTKRGVDGFRCDVGPMVSVDFWLAVRKAVDAVDPDHIWLCESSDHEFIRNNRSRGWHCASDSEMYEAFDMTYDYDVLFEYVEATRGRAPIAGYIDGLIRQQSTYPENYIKLHFLENHDQLPAASFIRLKEQLMQWTAFCYFLKGAMLLYNGQEFMNTWRLWEQNGEYRTMLRKDDPDFTKLLLNLSAIKKMPIIKDGIFRLDHIKQDSVVTIRYNGQNGGQLMGIFNLRLLPGEAEAETEEGEYQNLLSGQFVTVKNGKIILPVEPIIIYKQ